MASARQVLLDLKLVLALRALERADATGEFLPRAERKAWSREAGLDGLPESPAPERVLRKLAERARIANGRRLPWTVRPVLIGLAGAGLPRAVAIVVPVAAFGFGLASLQFGEQRAVNLLALPLVLLLAWNALVYLWLVVLLVRRVGCAPRRSGFAAGVIAGSGGRQALGRLRRERDDSSGAWHDAITYARRAVDGWRDSFAEIAGPLLHWRLAGLLHFTAALWAIGAIAGLYHQGWSRSYHAYWESTLLDAGSARVWFGALFSPASSVCGLPLPLGELSSLQGLPEPAAEATPTALPWFNLYAATLGLFIVAPRLLLAGTSWIAFRWQVRRAIRAPLLRAYFADVRRGASDGAEVRRWIVAASEPAADLPPGTVELLERWGAARELFDQVELRLPPPAPGPASGREQREQVDAVLFGAERTPDDAVRAELAALRESAGGGGAMRVVFLHAARFLQRFAGLPAAADRWRDRQAAWREAVGGEPLALVIIGEPPAAKSTVA